MNSKKTEDVIIEFSWWQELLYSFIFLQLLWFGISIFVAMPFREDFCNSSMRRLEYVFPARPVNCWLLQPVGKIGTLHQGQAVNYEEIKCSAGKPYHLMFDIKTNFDIMKQQGVVSWQCDGTKDRKYILLDEYTLSMSYQK